MNIQEADRVAQSIIDVVSDHVSLDGVDKRSLFHGIIKVLEQHIDFDE